jgi:23S rRNA (guanosine2251-2'-O)-methyltransferase
VEEVWLTEHTARELEEELETLSVPVHAASHDDLEQLCGSSDHQGVVALASPFAYLELPELLALEDNPLVLCLDQVTDPRNLGAIARVADASGATGLLIPERGAARVTGSVCKTSAGAVEHVPIAICTNLATALDQAKGANVWVYGASEKATRMYTDVDMRVGTLLVFGAEGGGIRPRVRAQCDELVQVPMEGEVSSLNVATVAALVTYEAIRQRSAGEGAQ